MKRNAIIRIVIFSIVILTLVGILAAILLADTFVFRFDNNHASFADTDILEGTVGNSGSVSAAEVKDIQIKWVAGKIEIIPGDTDEIIFTEYGASDEDQRMVWKQSGDELEIQYSKSTDDWDDFISFGVNIDYSKNLTITVPKDWVCGELDIDAASAQVEITGLTVNEIDLASASGTVEIDSCNVGDLTLETVSGDINFAGTLNTLSCSAVSADCYIEAMNIPKRICMDGVSGNLDLTLPADCGFTASVDTVSGSFSSDFATTNQNGSYTYGDGTCRIDMDGVSGDITIRKMEAAG